MGRKASKQLEDQRQDYEESNGLLSGDIRDGLSDVDSEGSERSGWSRGRFLCVASSFILLLMTGVRPPPPYNSYTLEDAGDLRSNGTHEFKRTVSIDGLRADYLDRGLTPHLLDISKQGLRA
ncbi:hypothetical protein GGG16DRAFT_115614 [Schizophyllum commune]|nr:hypothetical protein K525DRAFT_278174 [Schizophyllum commune Loenen D]